MNKRSPLFWFALLLTGMGVLTALGPAEKSLGTNVRVVYLHGVWVWVALVAYILAGGVGLAGILVRRERLHRWSRALGRTGLFFWLTYLPISLWAMQTNWNGLFLAEPRWRVAIVFAVGGVLLQAGLTLVEDPLWASGGNLVYVAALLTALNRAEQVMHPPSPIVNSDAWRIQLFFGGLMALGLLAGWQVTRWWHQYER